MHLTRIILLLVLGSAYSASVQKSVLKAAYKAAKCCPLQANHNKCNIVDVPGITFTQFTCDQIYELYCEAPNTVEIEECELCWGEHTDPDCIDSPPSTASSPPPTASSPPPTASSPPPTASSPPPTASSPPSASSPSSLFPAETQGSFLGTTATASQVSLTVTSDRFELGGSNLLESSWENNYDTVTRELRVISDRGSVTTLFTAENGLDGLLIFASSIQGTFKVMNKFNWEDDKWAFYFCLVDFQGASFPVALAGLFGTVIDNGQCSKTELDRTARRLSQMKLFPSSFPQRKTR